MASNIYYVMDALGWSPGFFCNFQSVVGFLNFCEQEQPVGMKVFFEKGLYFDEKVGPNWWEYYFEPINTGEIPQDSRVEHIGDMLKSHWGTEAISTMSKERASELIKKYIKIKPFIQTEIDHFAEKHFHGNYVIGIHYRGTDKSSEAPRVAFDKVRLETLKIIEEHPKYKIFVASDEQGFINYMRSKFGDSVVFIPAHRSPNHEPIHHIAGEPVGNGFLLGKEAVVDCYLLSKTHTMIRTHSNLSSSAANINPSLIVINLNTPSYRQGLR